jgi:sugar phosphate isomerase/epimerase
MKFTFGQFSFLRTRTFATVICTAGFFVLQSVTYVSYGHGLREQNSSENQPNHAAQPNPVTQLNQVEDPGHLLSEVSDFPEDKVGWHLSVQTYTFNRYTLVEAIEMAKRAGLKTIEVFGSQRLGGGMTGRFEVNMPEEDKKAIREILNEAGVRIVALGVVNADTEAGWRKLYEFAHEWGVYVINVEPNPDFLPLIGNLANQFKIRTAIHNHPKPSKYWDPNVVLDAIKTSGSEYVGACADIGHWVRSGLDPIEALKQLEGKVFSLHLKDLKERSSSTHDVHWGTGVSNVEGVIKELLRQQFNGNISAEYEYNWENNVVDVKQSVQNFREILNRLL